MNQGELPLLIRGGRVLDPGQGIDQVGDLLLEGGKVAWLAPAGHSRPVPPDCEVLEARGLVVCPGFVDLHCHLREPGFEEKESIATGALAAARGGFTTICAMPNTNPPVDNAALVQQVLRRAREDGAVRVLPIGCVTVGRAGKALVEMAELAGAGAVAFSDDGDPVADPFIMRMALAYSAPLGLPIINHCQDPSLSRGGVVHEGWAASRLGLRGMPAAAEEAMAARDIELTALTGGRLHLAHISTAGTLELLRRAKERGLRVTAEVTPHHLLLTEGWVLGRPPGGRDGLEPPDPYAPLSPAAYDTRAKVNPPLRTSQDAAALVQGLREGLIDAIATDHAPHSAVDKACSFDDAAFGISGLETALGLLLSLVHRGDLSLLMLIQRLTADPARVLGPRWAHLGTLRPGAAADVTIFDPKAEWVVDPETFASKGKNTPLEGVTLRGKVVATVAGGSVVWRGEAWCGGRRSVPRPLGLGRQEVRSGMPSPACLVLADGATYEGEAFGAPVSSYGEVVFTTAMTGYQEMLTDPSFAGQIVAPTYPLQGNYGISAGAFESARAQVAGFVVRSWSDAPSHALSRRTLHDYLASQGVPGLSGVDTRALTRKLRSHGVMMGALAVGISPAEALERLRSVPQYGATDFVARVSTQATYRWRDSPEPWRPNSDLSAGPRIVVTDYGVKYNILRILQRKGCQPLAVPAGLSAEEVLALKPQGVVLSPGPGDPALLEQIVGNARVLAERLPTLGICLGHQVIAQAFGGRTYKLKFGHRGANHPVKELATGRVCITAQNHGYAVDADSLPPELEVSHVDLNDGTVEGLRHRSLPLLTIQYHAEASPGPRDNEYIFDRFLGMVHDAKK